MTITSYTSSAPVGIWSGSSFDDLELIAPSEATDEVTGPLGSPVTNSRGDVAFVSAFQQRAWIYRDGQLHLLALGGQAAPGTTPTRTFLRFEGIVLNGGKTVLSGQRHPLRVNL